ncbi:hypothetical protein PPGU19_092140 (plasmid) [Paraburkholderia sp. PGU19]|nr:hypothetical protein PPGU19_092140 [Paraburkholderia sp. PGU19]
MLSKTRFSLARRIGSRRPHINGILREPCQNQKPIPGIIAVARRRAGPVFSLVESPYEGVIWWLKADPATTQVMNETWRENELSPKMVIVLKALACLCSLLVLAYGTLGLATHSHLHLIYILTTVLGIASGMHFTSKTRFEK